MEIRWADETRSAAEHLGWIVVETNGVEDWQGWGVHLLKRPDSDYWAVMQWSYGSCSGCDEYEDCFGYSIAATPERCAEVFRELIEHCDSEEAARLKFQERKGW